MDANWGQYVTLRVGEAVKAARARLGMSAGELSRSVTEFGVPMSRSVIADLETGRRSAVSVSELMAVAWVLQVPPLLLLYPDMPDGLAELMPGAEGREMDGALWFMGLQDIMAGPGASPTLPTYLDGKSVVEWGTSYFRPEMDTRMALELMPWVSAWWKFREATGYRNLGEDSGTAPWEEGDVEDFLRSFVEVWAWYMRLNEAGYTVDNPLGHIDLPETGEHPDTLTDLLAGIGPTAREQLRDALEAAERAPGR